MPRPSSALFLLPGLPWSWRGQSHRLARTACCSPSAQPAPLSAQLSAPLALPSLRMHPEGTQALAASPCRARLCVSQPRGSFLLPPGLSPPWPSKPAAGSPAAGRALLAREAPRRPLPEEAESRRHPPTLFPSRAEQSRAKQERRMPALSQGGAFMPGWRAWGGAGHAGGTWPVAAEARPPPCVARGCFADAVSSPAPTRSISPCNYPARTLASCHQMGQMSPAVFSLSRCVRGHAA